MKNLQELKNQIKNYFNYMFENKSKEEVAKYNYDSFLDFETFLEEIKSRFVRNIDINDFSDDEIGVAYDSAIEELLNLNYLKKKRKKMVAKNRRERNREKKSEYQKKWRERNREKNREYHKKWIEKNREKRLEYHKKYYEENKEKISEKYKEKTYEKNKEKIKKYLREYKKKRYLSKQMLLDLEAVLTILT